MTIIADMYAYVIGVDTHARNHVFSVWNTTRRVHEDTASFPTSPAGLTRALHWAGRRTEGVAEVLWVIEGAGSYGAVLAAKVTEAGYLAVEPGRMNTALNHATGKDDEADARRIAESVLALEPQQLRYRRLDEGARAVVAVLLGARDAMSAERTGHINQLTALVRLHELGVDARGPLSNATIREIAAWRARPSQSMSARVARSEAVRQAKRIVDLDEELKANHLELAQVLKDSIASVLLEETGIGPVNAARALVAFSHQGRVRDEAAFASLAGVSPIPASSGNTRRHRLNRGGDRQLNRAMHSIVMTRIRCDTDTQTYMQRRMAEGRTKREIKRCLKRYVARHIFKVLNAQPTT